MFRRLLLLMPILGAAVLVLHGTSAGHALAAGHFWTSARVGLPFED